jgi:hypothetical protein
MPDDEGSAAMISHRYDVVAATLRLFRHEGLTLST